MVTRAFYARADLDLVLSSPASSRKVFAVRIMAIALSTTALAVPLAAPFVNVLAWSGGPRWLGAYGVVIAMGLAASALAMALTVGLFRLIGPRRTRFVAQIVAAIVGAFFVIGVQAVAILSTNTLSRFAALQSEALKRIAPGDDSFFWWPARAIMGDLPALVGVLAASIVLLGAAILLFSRRFAMHATAAAGISATSVRQRRRADAFRPTTPARMLRRKEWTLLRRDPWLVSQTLMQVLYLLPPALMLWRNFGDHSDTLVVLVPVFVMAAGQLAGGLAWLAVSGEDAPDLVATAPISASHHLARQARGGHRRYRHGAVAGGRRACAEFASTTRSSRARASWSPRPRRRRSSSGFASRRNAAISAAGRRRRASRRSRKPFRRSRGRRRPASPLREPGSRWRRRRSRSAFWRARGRFRPR